MNPLCNLCGLTCVTGAEGSPSRGPHGLIDTTVIVGYDSTPGNGYGALDDMIRHKFNLCEFCLDWLFSQFTIPVAVDDCMNDYLTNPHEVPPWKPAEQRVREDDWRKEKESFFLEKAKRDLGRILPKDYKLNIVQSGNGWTWELRDEYDCFVYGLKAFYDTELEAWGGAASYCRANQKWWIK